MSVAADLSARYRLPIYRRVLVAEDRPLRVGVILYLCCKLFQNGQVANSDMFTS